MTEEKDQNEEQHEMNVVTVHQPQCPHNGHTCEQMVTTAAAKENKCMKYMRDRITKLLTVIVLILLALVVVALKKHFHLENGWENAHNYTKHSIAQLQNSHEDIIGQVGEVLMSLDFDEEYNDARTFLSKVTRRITVFNKTMIIRNEWNKAGTELYYKRFAQKSNYTTAERECNGWMGGRLARETLRRQGAISYVSSHPVWVGYEKVNGNWGWTDGAKTNDTIVENVITDDVDGEMNCGFISGESNGKHKLNATSCSREISWLCEVDLRLYSHG